MSEEGQQQQQHDQQPQEVVEAQEAVAGLASLQSMLSESGLLGEEGRELLSMMARIQQLEDSEQPLPDELLPQLGDMKNALLSLQAELDTLRRDVSDAVQHVQTMTRQLAIDTQQPTPEELNKNNNE